MPPTCWIKTARKSSVDKVSFILKTEEHLAPLVVQRTGLKKHRVLG